MKILIVEDTEDSRIFLKDILESNGFDIVEAKNGREALDIVENGNIELIITDILMPDLDGYDLCRKIKENELTRHIPVIFYTATYTDERDVQLGLALGASRYLLKPLDPMRLLKEIEYVLKEGTTKDILKEKSIISTQYAEVLSRKLNKKLKELKQEKEESEELRKQIQAITDSIPLLLSEIDKEYRYKYVNATYEKWHGKHKRILLGEPVSLFYSPKDYSIIKEKLNEAFRGNTVLYETGLKFGDGQWRYVQVLYSPQYSGIEVSTVYETIIDNTKRYQIEQEQERLRHYLQQSQKLELIGQLTGGIAHDFNNILASILGFSSLCSIYLEKKPDETLIGYVDQIDKAGKRGKEIIAQLLAFCRGSGKKASIVDVNSAIENIVTLLKPVLQSTVVVSINLSDDALKTSIDPIQLDQIVMNLCINARDSMDGVGNLSISTMKWTRKGLQCTSCLSDITEKYIDIIISDNGEGIESVNMQRIFEPFFTTKDTGKGTGMGLSLVHGIVHEYGGHIYVESEKGKGASFHVLLPEVIDGVSSETLTNRNIELV